MGTKALAKRTFQSKRDRSEGRSLNLDLDVPDLGKLKEFHRGSETPHGMHRRSAHKTDVATPVESLVESAQGQQSLT